MMRILAIETSSDILSICVMENSKLLGEYTIKNLKTHSPKILPMIDTLLKELDLDILDIDIFATSIGPGSFTGLRIGVSVAKSLAQANDKKIIGVSTLLSIAKNIQVENEVICPIIDAKNNNVYTCIFDSNYQFIKEYTACTIEEILEECKNMNVKINFIGDGSISFKEKILELNLNCSIVSESFSYPTSKSIAIVANEKSLKNEYDDYFTLAPMYLKPSQAERLHGHE